MWSIKSEGANTLYAHSITLGGLSAGTTYQYRIKAKDLAGNESTSEIKSFTTTAAPAGSNSGSGSGGSQQNNNTQQTISNVHQEKWNPGTVRITWQSSLPSTSWVFASASANDNTPISSYEMVLGRNDGVTEHEIFIDGLDPAVTYSFRVFSRSADNQTAISGRQTFIVDDQDHSSGQSQAANNGNNGDYGYQPLEGWDANQPTTEQIRQEAAAAAGDAASAEGGTTAAPERSAASPMGDFFYGALFWLVRSLFGLVILALVIILLIMLFKKKKNNSPGKIVANAEKSKNISQAVAPGAPAKKSHLGCWIIAIILIIFLLIFLKSFLTFFIPLPF